MGLGIVLLFWFYQPLLSTFRDAYQLLTQRERITAFVESFGVNAPLAFMTIQVLQVILAPIPGEATGFIGGYLFGALKGCFYSTLALTLGSWINFFIGRFLGKRWVRQILPADKWAKYDSLIRRQGILVVFILFLFPGFPKDYLCLFLGISTLPLRLFLLMALVGRIPGTLMLSLQGALVFEKNYLIFSLIIVINLIGVYLMYRHRESLYSWVEKINGQPPPEIDEKAN